jgi:hypothetical protein
MGFPNLVVQVDCKTPIAFITDRGFSYDARDLVRRQNTSRSTWGRVESSCSSFPRKEIQRASKLCAFELEIEFVGLC